jgi:UbiD family decarboxylase
MAFRDLREFIAAAEATGDLQLIKGAHWDLEIGCITELSAEREGPLLLFDAVPGYPEGFRIVTNFLGTSRRFALALGLSPDLPKIEILRAWKEKSRQLEYLPPAEVESGPVMENVIDGDEVNLELFPAPKWHELDGGRYIGTADLVVTRDPQSGWVNVGTYRACIQGKNRLSLWILDHKHGKQIARQYWEQGRSCPVAIVLGCEPATWMAGPSAVKAGASEYDYAGGLRGAPVEVIKPPLTGLPVPAFAEIVLEGEIPPLEEESVLEGPFGEWPGYYTHIGRECVVRVKRIMHRHQPILLGNPPLLPITERYGIPLFAARVWEHLESAGISDIQGVWGHCHTLMIVISLKQKYPGHAVQALTATAGLQAGASMYRYIIAVDDDIDPSDLKQVLWAMTTRVDPSESVQILRSWTSDLDPRVPPEKREKGDYTSGRILVDACRPFTWRDQFAAPNRFSAAKRKQISEKWSAVLKKKQPGSGT